VTDTLASQLQDFRQSTSSTGNVQTKLSVDQAQSLRALGYLGSESSESTAGNEEGPDPKDDIDVANDFHDALTDMENERYSDAVSKLEKIVTREPNTNMAYLELGRAYVHVKEYNKAIPPLQRAVEKSPDDVLGRYELAQAFVKTSRWEEAVPHLEVVADRTPQSAEMHFNLAVACMKTNRMPEAVKAFQDTIKLEPDNFRANLLLGRLYGMQQDGKSALPYLLAAAKIDPKSVEAHMFLANVYIELGQAQKAERERALVEKLKAAGGQE
jgi:predicted Zn-dependent protease